MGAPAAARRGCGARGWWLGACGEAVAGPPGGSGPTRAGGMRHAARLGRGAGGEGMPPLSAAAGSGVVLSPPLPRRA